MGPISSAIPTGPSLLRVLVVEDEILIAMELEMVLTDAGFDVIGPVPVVAAALALLKEGRPDAAVLDMNLRGERVTPVAEVLRAMGVPFVLTSAYGAGELASDPALADAQNIGKPTNKVALLGALRGLLKGQ